MMSRTMKSSFDSHQTLEEHTRVSTNLIQPNALLIRPCYKRYVSYPCQQGDTNNAIQLESHRYKNFKT